jgi:hypothetical protein
VRLAAKQIICKFFDPASAWTWYVVEGQAEEDDFLFRGLVCGDCPEWRYFRLKELQTARDRLGLPIERDIHFQPSPVAAIMGAA